MEQNKYKVLTIGEILMDLFPDGARLGGAPMNVAWHTHGLGADSTAFSRIGDDQVGKDILSCLAERGIETNGLKTDPVHPTGTVKVELSPKGNPTYTIVEGVAWDFIELGDKEFSMGSNADAICFGSLAQRNDVSRKAIQSLVAATPDDSFRFFDINLRLDFYSKEIIDNSLKLATGLKLNDEELPILAEYYNISGNDIEVIAALTERFSFKLVAYTLGEEGSILYTPDKTSECPFYPAEVVNTVGAGDCFTSTVIMGYLTGMSLDDINKLANKAAAYVCTQDSATPILPQDIINELK